MLIQLTHPMDNYDFWVESTQIAALERYNKPTTTLITLDEKPAVTAIVLICGKVMSCKETPDEIIKLFE